MKILSIFILILIFISNCATTVKIPVVTHSPKDFNEFMHGGRNLGIYVYKKDNIQMDLNPSWKSTIEGAVVNSLQKKRYFKIVDVSTKEDRLKEVAFSQKMGGMKDLSKDLSVDALLFIHVPQSPKYECIDSSQKETKQVCESYDSNKKCTRYADKDYTVYKKTLYSTVFVNARLVNIETGQMLQHSNSEPSENAQTSTNRTVLKCPSKLSGFNYALNLASGSIADRISPTVKDMKVPIYKDAVGLSESSSNKSEIKDLLSVGNKWLDTDNPNLEYAKKSWDQALKLSGSRSASANWNLGVYHWAKADFKTADMYFVQATEKGGPDWIDSEKREVLSAFESEKQRALKGNNE